jgi:hypothetical protein
MVRIKERFYHEKKKKINLSRFKNVYTSYTLMNQYKSTN